MLDELYAQPMSRRNPSRSPQRPSNLDLRGPLNRPAASKATAAYLPSDYAPPNMTNIATVIDPTYMQQRLHSNSTRSTSSSANTPQTPASSEHQHRDYYDDYPEEDHRSPPSPPAIPPPYMPYVQGTRRMAMDRHNQGGGSGNGSGGKEMPLNYSREMNGGKKGAGGSGKSSKNKDKCAQQ